MSSHFVNVYAEAQGTKLTCSTTTLGWGTTEPPTGPARSGRTAPPRVPSLASLARRVSVGPWQRRRHTLDSWAPRWQASCSSRPRTFQHRRHAPSRTTRLHADVDVPTAARSDFKRPKKSSSMALTVYRRADKMFILALHENTQPLRTSVSSL